MARFVGEEVFDEFAGRPVGEVVGRGEVVAVGVVKGRLEDAVETGERDGGVGGHDGFVEELAERGADVVGGAEAAEFAAAFAQETGVAGGFSDVLAEEIL